jgi:chaperonin GroEL
MIEKEILFGDDAKRKLINGVNIVADAVKVTLGAAGRNVAIEDERGLPHLSKDGVTVAMSINLSDPTENLGASIIKQASMRSADNAGDGTTSTAVLTQSIVNKAITLIDEKTNITQFKKGMEMASRDIVGALKKQSKKVNKNTLKSVARISSNNDAELGNIIADAYFKVGVDGVVTMEESMSSETYVEIIDGTKINKGFISPYLVTNQEKQEAVLENPLVFISDQEIKSLEDIVNILEVAVSNKRSILIVADVDPGVINSLNVNKAKGIIKVNVVSPEGIGIKRFELLEDLCALTGAKLASDETGNDLSAIDATYLGEAIKCISDVSKTVLITDKTRNEDEINARINSVKDSMENSENKMNLWHYKDRLSRLNCGIAVVKVGANSEVEMKEKKDRVDDAIKATRAALEEGILPGGGIALIDTLNSLNQPNLNSDFGKGYTSVWYSLSSPFNQILKNAGIEPESIFADGARNKSNGYGYNVITEEVGDMFKMGVIDATKVVRNSIENAVSVSSILLTTEATITNKRI